MMPGAFSSIAATVLRPNYCDRRSRWYKSRSHLRQLEAQDTTISKPFHRYSSPSPRWNLVHSVCTVTRNSLWKRSLSKRSALRRQACGSNSFS
jgi:hypothetical protein